MATLSVAVSCTGMYRSYRFGHTSYSSHKCPQAKRRRPACSLADRFMGVTSTVSRYGGATSHGAAARQHKDRRRESKSTKPSPQ
eukprot:5613848-Pleurochrysis_carterae.AAC.1